MKKREKRQILELIKTMQNANQKLALLCKNDDVSSMISILADEQESAILIGNRIEEIEGKDTQAVSLLEEYCEILWQVTQVKTEGQRKQGIGVLPILLNQVIKSVEEFQETEKIDVVFLPYNASMWDCMETVWRAAKDDPDCNTKVVPIPYFEVNPDGSIGMMHYEGALFPKEVPITSYQEYDLKKQYPDIVYIHNPYDEYNKVTRVHPDFYSSSLRNYTDMLVYIPYYISNGHLPEAHHFLPAYIYADKIIIQDKMMMDEIHQDIPKEKLLPLGSPKAERIIWMETHKEQLDFPDEWKKKAQGKKIIFYNVSISALLKYREKILDKMEEVFQVVRSRDDSILLWRPHPLLEATLTSMCVELVERYRKLVHWYKKKNIGILDQTADPGKAVVFADAYIGECSSSIVDLFRTVDKPRLFMTVEQYHQPTIDEMKSEITYDVCKVGDVLWFVTAELQMLCKYNLKTGKIEAVAAVPRATQLSYAYTVYFEGKVILVPDQEDALCIYDIEKGSFTKKYFKDEYVNGCFGGAVIYRHYLYLTPKNYPALVRYDIRTEEFKYFKECIEDILKEIQIKNQGSPFGWGVSSYGSKLYIASMCSNHVLAFDMETYSYQVNRVGESSNMYRGMVSDESQSWFILRDNPKIVRWNRETNEVTEYGAFPRGFDPGLIPFKNILNFEDVIYLMPYSANYICKLDKVTGIISYAQFNLPHKVGEFASQYYKERKQPYFFAKKITDLEMAAMSSYNDSILVINTRTGECKSTTLRLENHIYWELRRNGCVLNEVCETKEMPISKYLECIVQELRDKLYKKGVWKEMFNTRSHIGEDIHQKIKNIMIKYS